MKRINHTSLMGLKTFLILWSTQALSALGSAMTSFALVVWSYQQQGSALTTALLSVCSYAPYVALSMFAGSLGDRWDRRRTMMVCDGFAALTTLAALGLVELCTGLANLAGSLLVTALPEPKSRVRVICDSLLFSMSTENLLLALGRSGVVWCFGSVLGWICVPVMNANMDALLRLHIPVEMQGRVYAARNTLQFFTIPVGYLLGGVLVDRVCEPLMAAQGGGSLLAALLGTGKGSGAALLFLVIAGAGVGVCLAFRGDKHLWRLEDPS